MDFTKKDTRTAGETAQFCHLKDQDTGKPIYDGDNAVGVMVLGSMARSVQLKLREDARAKLQDAPDDEAKARAIEDIQQDLVESASRLTVGFVGVDRGDKPARAPDDCEWFYDLNMFSIASILAPKEGKFQKWSFAQQVLDFAQSGANYLGNA
jgi:hypothetical protein